MHLLSKTITLVVAAGARWLGAAATAAPRPRVDRGEGRLVRRRHRDGVACGDATGTPFDGTYTATLTAARPIDDVLAGRPPR